MSIGVKDEKTNLCLFLMDTSQAVKGSYRYVYGVVECWMKARLRVPNTMTGLMVMGNQVKMINGFSVVKEPSLIPISNLVPKGKLLLEEGLVKAAEMLESYKKLGDFSLIITCFIYAPITSDERSILKLGKSFNKKDINFEIVRLGESKSNDRLLIKFIDLVNGNDKMRVKAHLRVIEQVKKSDKHLNKRSINHSFSSKEKRRRTESSDKPSRGHTPPTSYAKLDNKALMKELLNAPSYDPDIDAFPDITKMSKEEQKQFRIHLDTVRAAERTLKKYRGLLKTSLPLSHKHNKSFMDYYIQSSKQMSPGIHRSYEALEKALTEVLYKEIAREMKKGSKKSKRS